MLHSATSVLSFILWSSYLSLGCFPLPLSETSSKSEAGVSTNLTKRDPTAGKFFLGYRYICAHEFAAWEYQDAKGKLTDFKASNYQLGEGAYLAPNSGTWEAAGNYLCEIWVDLDKIKAAPRRLIPEPLLRNRLGLPPLSGVSISKEQKEAIAANMMDPTKGMAGIEEYLQSGDEKQKLEDTILISIGYGSGVSRCFQMVIPPHYLQPSKSCKRPGGKGDLGMYVKCVMRGHPDPRNPVHRLNVPVGTRADWSELFPELKDDKDWNGPGCRPST
ncbi:hypothetical protein F5880DRAFT_1600739 [Lentinula raphanica]|nr:hypothetical protein F5880DRAFT_1600739 [Lentinula raphanica]